MRSLRIAFGLLTTLPLRLPGDWSAGDSGRASVWYSFVGLVVGALTWLVWRASMFVFPPLVAGVVTLAVWVALTGGLHLDGLADCCDGLLASVSVERRLEIMKDPHMDAFGVIGLILILFLKAARSEERRVGKSVDFGGRRIIKKKTEMKGRAEMD